MQLFAKKPESGFEPRSATDPLKQNTGSQGPGTAGPGAHSHQTPPPAPRAGTSPATVISEDITIEGNITADREIRLEGRVEGDLRGNAVVIGESGSVNGSIAGDEVAVHGRVNGSIEGRNVMLYKTAHVEGDIRHQGIGIEMGTHYDGRLKWVEPEPAQAGVSHAATPPPPPPPRAAPQPVPYSAPGNSNGADDTRAQTDTPVSIAYDAQGPASTD